MRITYVIATLTGAVAFAAWTYLIAARGRFWRVRDESQPAHESPRRSIAAVIPARDEAQHVAEAVRSLVAQDQTGPLTVIVVDDHSSDRTGDIARSAGADVIAAPPLPAGWTGKMWAVAQGVGRARASHPDYILLTDADVVHGTSIVRSLMSRAEAEGLDLVSYMVLLRAESLPERLLIPAFVFFFLMLYPPAFIRSPRRRAAGAAGGCILIRRDALERIGGIEAIKGELIDDCALARRVKRSGGRVWMGLTRSSRSTRGYRTLGEIWNMIARTAFTQLRYSAALLVGTVVGMLAIYVAPVAVLFSGDGVSAVLGASTWVLMSVAYAPMLRFYGVPIYYAPVLPALAAFYTAATIGSAVRHWTGRGGMWKGRAQARVAVRSAR